MHPFESSGLGVAPFKCVGAYDSGAVKNSCNHCGTGIRLVYLVESADKVTSKVGSSCIMKAGRVSNFEGMKRTFQRGRREEAKKKAYEERQKVRKEALVGWWDKPENSDVGSWLMMTEGGDNAFLRDLTKKLASDDGLTEAQTAAAIEAMGRYKTQQNKNARSGFVGSVGQKIVTEVKIVASVLIRYNEYYGRSVPVYLNKMVDRNDNQISNFTSHGENLTDDYIKVSFIVKKHDVYKDTKTTNVNYLKKV